MSQYYETQQNYQTYDWLYRAASTTRVSNQIDYKQLNAALYYQIKERTIPITLELQDNIHAATMIAIHNNQLRSLEIKSQDNTVLK